MVAWTGKAAVGGRPQRSRDNPKPALGGIAGSCFLTSEIVEREYILPPVQFLAKMRIYF